MYKCIERDYSDNNVGFGIDTPENNPEWVPQGQVRLDINNYDTDEVFQILIKPSELYSLYRSLRKMFE